MKIALFHNILWSRYKGVVFSALHKLALAKGVSLEFFQFALTDSSRAVLSPVDDAYHKYPYTLIFNESYDTLSLTSRLVAAFRFSISLDVDVALLPSVDKPEYWLMLFVFRLRGIRCAVFYDSTLRDTSRSALRLFLKRFFFKLCAGVFCYGRRSTEALLYIGVPAQKIIIRYQAAALPLDYISERAIECRGSVYTSQVLRLLYVGRLSSEKRVDTLIDAIYLLKSKFDNIQLDIIGGGAIETDLRLQATKLGIDTCVHFHGGKKIEEIASFYSKATALVLPSSCEPWGLVVNEALSYGCPVVVSDACGCVPELVIDGITGHSFSVGDADSLAAALLLVVESLKVGSITPQTCVEHILKFNPETTAKQIIDGCSLILR